LRNYLHANVVNLCFLGCCTWGSNALSSIFAEIGNEEFDHCPLPFVKCLGSWRKSISRIQCSSCSSITASPVSIIIYAGVGIYFGLCVV